jgi:sodium/proline symporter
MCLGFGLTVVFNTLGMVEAETLSGIMAMLGEWARAPGDPAERMLPWVPALLVLWLGRGR